MLDPGKKTKSKIGPLLDPITNTLQADPSFSANLLSNQYSSVFTVPRPEWNIKDMNEFFNMDSVRLSPTLTTIDLHPDDIEIACSELKKSSSPGPDGVPSSLLMECKQELKLPLYYIWKESLKQGTIPPDLLLVQVCPIHKGGSKADPAQYRPVALTSHLIKVFERVVRSSLVNFLEQNGRLPENQHGFRKNRSTLTQLLAHWDHILDLLENGHTVDVIYTDFAKAFDKCESNVLLHTLRECGIGGMLGEWIAAFLDSKSRMQYVRVDGALSDLQYVISGVPQGTVLGPVLFLVHIMNLCSNLSADTHSSSFADDTRLWRGVKSATDCDYLQDDLETIYNAADHINMIFNSKKFEWLRYSPRNVQSPVYQYRAPDNTPIVLKQELRDLGVKMSSDLSFDLQVGKVVATANQMVGWGLRTFRTRRRDVMLQLLKSLVQPHLDYCSQLWSPSTQAMINKLENVQKSLIMKIKDKDVDSSDYWETLRNLRLFSQERRRERYQIIFIWKISQGLVAGYDIPFVYNNRTGRWAVPARISGSDVSAEVRQAKERSLRVRGCQLFNLLPATLRNSDHNDILMFKNNLDLYLSCVPDQPTTHGLKRAAQSNSLIHQIPLVQAWL